MRLRAQALALRWLLALFAVLAVALGASNVRAQTAQAGFDHLTTGFALSGAHSDVRCETCHIKGIFKGTPRVCDACHVQNNPRNAIAQPVNHVRTTQSCDTCHSTATFGGARFDHVLAMGQRCDSCHNGAQAIGKPANHPQTPAQSQCSDCHTTLSFATLTRPANHIPTLASSSCESCHVALTTGGSFANAMMNHTGYTSCAQCHAPSVANTFFGVRIQSSLTTPGHIPASDNCELCHTSLPTMLIPTTGAASVGGTTFASGRMNHSGISANCVQCHGSSVVAGTFIGVTPKTKAGLAPAHLPTSDTCENCHRNAIPAQLIPAAGAASIGATTFANGQMSHTGITSNCVACHGPTVTGTTFFGVSRIVTMPPTSPMGATSHIPSSTTCESCHLGSTPGSDMPANATATAPGTAFKSPAPTSAQIHAGVTSGCSTCHESSFVWMGMSAYPIAPTVMTAGASYTGFHTRPRAAAGTFNVADAAHPSTGDCSLCHSNTNAFTALDKPANHIPYAAAAQCTSCHTNPDFSVTPSLAAIHANAQSTSGNCAQCHSAANAPIYAIPSIGFRIVAPPGNHIPTNAACESCHVGAGSSVAATPVPNGATFANSRMNHAGITNNCASCHIASGSSTTFAGITNIVRMPPTSPVGPTSHIPTSASCESCHLGSLPTGQIPSNASTSPPGTGFATPAPTTTQIHSGITSGCSTCHEANSVWMGMSAYPIAPTVLTSGAQYTGFHTRPRAAAGTFNVADAAHPTTGDCSQCHSGTNFFTVGDKPANHIPYAANAQCGACHTNPDFSVMPTLANIHANAQSTTGNCAQCHSATNAAAYAIPAANFSIVAPPALHIPTSASCETCHVGTGSSVTSTPVPNGATFANSRMSHTGITSNCETCHTPAGTPTTFTGITNIVRMPPTSPVGANSHIPSNSTCSNCHLGTLANVSGLIPANATRSAPGTLFATPAPTTAQIHTGIASGCSGCHEASSVWMGMSAYPIAPTVLTSGAQYTGFHTRPRTAAGTFNVADAAHPTAGDCSQCHSGFNFFTAQDKPANHIPYAATAQCTSCHTNPDFSVMPTLANIHANAQSTTANCAQCHSATNAATYAIPAANFSIVAPPANHIPTSAACELCHVGTGSSVTSTPVPNGAKFSGSRMSHTGITNNCVACHTASGSGTTFAGITNIVRMPPTSPVGASSHIPSSTTCESCHLGTLANVSGLVPANSTRTVPGSLFATPAPTTTQIHSGITGGCSTCHEANSLWMGMSAYPIAPTVLTAGAQYTGFHTRPRAAAGTFNVADAAHPTAGDCSQCHSGFNFFTAQDKPANHIPYAATAQCTSCHTNPDFSVMPTLANIHANAQSTTANCAQCHGAAAPTFAIPAANFSIVGLPSNHIPTSASCELCHVGAGSSITSTPVPNGAKFSGSRMSHTGITNNCVACHTASGSGTTFAGITNIVRMPPTSPVGVNSHIPSGTTCETCHLGTLSNVSGLVAANATRSAPGTLFATPAPTTTQIHTGITSGCNACHDTGSLWMGMSAYPIAPTTLVAGAQYTGFHTRPVAAASTFSVADAAHPAVGDCSQCHSGFSFFSAQAKPPGHIPTQAPCTQCHVAPGDFSIAGLTTSMATLHTGIASGCITCHTAGAGAGPFAGCATQATCSSPPPLTYQPKTMPLAAGGSPTAPSPQTHVPAVGIACEKCHVTTTFTTFSGMQMRSNTTAHQAVGAYTCITCHEGGPPAYTWFGVTIVTRPVGHEGRRAGQDCIACHTRVYTQFSGAQALLRPVLRAGNTAPRLLPGGVQLPAITAPAGTTFDHQGVLPGQCKSCHNGVAARGLSAKHLPVKTSCDTCHRTTTWLPAQFSHQGIAPGDCTSCHNGALAVGKPGGHFLTARSCDSCHRVVSWLPATYAHISPAYRPTPDKPFCVSCHVTNGEIIPRVMHSNPRVRPVPMTP